MCRTCAWVEHRPSLPSPIAWPADLRGWRVGWRLRRTISVFGGLAPSTPARLPGSLPSVLQGPAHGSRGWAASLAGRCHVSAPGLICRVGTSAMVAPVFYGALRLPRVPACARHAPSSFRRSPATRWRGIVRFLAPRVSIFARTSIVGRKDAARGARRPAKRAVLHTMSACPECPRPARGCKRCMQ